MANAQRENLFEAGKLEDMCKKRSEEYQGIKANYEAWCVDQQQNLQTEREELEDELRQLKKNLSDVEQGDSRASEELGKLLSRPWMHREDSPDIEELFAEADRWNSDLRRIRADRDRPSVNKQAIVRDIEKIQNKLEGLPAKYALIRKEETQRLKEQLEDLWRRQNQSYSLTIRPANDVVQRQTRLLTGASPFVAEGFSSTHPMHEQRNERSREASLEIISSEEFRQSTYPSRSNPYPLHGQPGVRPATVCPDPTPAQAPKTSRTSVVPMITPQHRLSKSSSNAAVFFRDRQGRFQAQRAAPGREPYRATPQEYQKSSPTPSPASSRLGRANTPLLSNTHAEGTHANRDSTGSPHLQLAGNRPSYTRRAQADAEAIVITAVQPARHEVQKPYDRANGGKQAKTGHRSQVSGSESESDVPLAKRHKKAAKMIHFDQVNAENKNWRGGDKIYRISEYIPGSKEWYIFPCKKHCTGLKHARGAADHLGRRGNGHPEGYWTSAQAVKELGVRVVGCDAGKSSRNNDAFDRAVGQGYRPSQRCNNRDCPVHAPVGGPPRHSNPGQGRQSEDLEDSDSHSDEAFSEIPRRQRGNARAQELWQKSDPSPIVLDPIPGEIYQAYWTSDHSWYPVAVLPWGNLREVGLVGSLDETDLFKEKLPTCFAVEESQDGLRIVGWKKDFELHQRRVSERKFPCMFFEGISAVLSRDDESPQPVQNLAWVMAKHIRPINFRHRDGQYLNEAGLDEAKAFRERVIMLKSKGAQEPPRFSQPLVEDDSDVAGGRETPHSKHSTRPKSVKMEQDVDFWL